jgi:hypothetical protein
MIVKALSDVHPFLKEYKFYSCLKLLHLVAPTVKCPTLRVERSLRFCSCLEDSMFSVHLFHVLIVSVNKCLSTSIQFLTIDVILFVFLAMLAL